MEPKLPKNYEDRRVDERRKDYRGGTLEDLSVEIRLIKEEVDTIKKEMDELKNLSQSTKESFMEYRSGQQGALKSARVMLGIFSCVVIGLFGLLSYFAKSTYEKVDRIEDAQAQYIAKLELLLHSGSLKFFPNSTEKEEHRKYK